MAMPARSAFAAIFLSLLQSLLFQVCAAGEYCRVDGAFEVYCSNGCCGTWYTECCEFDVTGLAVGVSIGGIVLIIVVIVVCCVCCRRGGGSAGQVVVQQQPGTMVLQTTSMSANPGKVTTSGMPPGYAYPSPPYGQPTSNPYTPSSYAAAPHAPYAAAPHAPYGAAPHVTHAGAPQAAAAAAPPASGKKKKGVASGFLKAVGKTAVKGLVKNYSGDVLDAVGVEGFEVEGFGEE